MRNICTLTLLFFLPAFLSAQAPSNDDCDGVINLGEAPVCPDSTVFSNVDATPSDIGFGNIPTCFQGGTVGNDVWFSFVSSDTILDYTITVSGFADDGNPMANPQVALYRGACAFDNLAELACSSGEPGSDVVELEVSGLTPGVTYFLRVSDYSASGTPNWGDFTLCVIETPPASTIDEEGSTACSGVLYDTGGPDGDYGNNENHTFTICPDNPPECLEFTLDYYFLEPGGGFAGAETLAFYDGEEATAANLIADIGGFDFNDDGGSGVCFRVVAQSGCMTIQFTSDSDVTFQGFEGHWQCLEDCEVDQPITVDSDVSEQDVIDFVSTPVTTVEVANIDCPGISYGTFTAGDDTDLGLERGLLLTSGSADWAVGPNNDQGFGNLNSNNMAEGDPDLDVLSDLFGNGVISNNACIVEFDVFVTADQLTFEYIFGSEEYTQYVNSDFNDIFAFLVSGPGITGLPELNNQQNIAILPGTNTPVEINTVNNELNWEYYRSNEYGQSVQYNGLTSGFMGMPKSLTARANVIPCNTYRLKLAIADRGDTALDSGVFISELKGGTPNVFVSFNSGIDYLVEDCIDEPDDLVIELDEPVADTTTFVITVGGSASQGEDYLLNLPDTITFLPGENELTFPITTLSDALVEGTENITITLSNDFGCGEVIYTVLNIELRDEINVDVLAGLDTALVCADSTRQLSASGAATYFWTPVSVIDEPTSPNPVASPENSLWVQVVGNVGPCSDVDSVFLQVVEPLIEVEALDPTKICEGDSIRLQVTSTLAGSDISWVPSETLSNADSTFTVASPEISTDYVVTASVSGCTISDTISTEVTLFDVPQVAADTTICENFSVFLGEDLQLDTITTVYQWAPGFSLDNDTIPNPLAAPEQTTTYQLLSTSNDGFCEDLQEVTVTVLAADVEIDQPDTTEICLGTGVELTASTTTGTPEGLLWSPDNGTLSDTAGLTVTVTPEVSQWYFATYTLGSCSVTDSVYFRVDSLPANQIMAEPAKEFYCQGEIVTLTSPIFEPVNFPDIEHLWEPSTGQETGDSLWNMVLTTQDTLVYQRITTNRACVDTAEILINVVIPPQAAITPSDTSVCFGEPVSFELVIEGGYDSFEWAGEGLSCTDCLNPTAANASGPYSVEIDKMGCPSNVSAFVNNTASPELELQTNATICPGESIQLNFATSGNANYTWTSTEPGFSSNEPELVVSPTGTTTYFVVADNGQCDPVEGEVTITVAQTPTLEIEGPEVICFGEEALISAIISGDTEEGTYVWLGSDGTSFDSPDIMVSPNFDTDYTLTYISGSGCDTLTQSVSLQVLNSINLLGIDVQPDTASSYIQGQTVAAAASYNSDLESGIEFIWVLGQDTVASGDFLDVAEIQLLQAGELELTLITVSENGCTDMISVFITVDPVEIAMPNTFTPNGDGTNDFFNYVTNAPGQVEVTDFMIYNRWGQLVYSNENPDRGWDGTLNGDPQPSEVYFYYLRALNPNGDVLGELKGDVTLLR